MKRIPLPKYHDLPHFKEWLKKKGLTWPADYWEQRRLLYQEMREGLRSTQKEKP